MVVSYAAVIYLLKLDAEDMLVIGSVRRKFAGYHTSRKGKR